MTLLAVDEARMSTVEYWLVLHYTERSGYGAADSSYTTFDQKISRL
jgi:hypothetical protein